ncbi:hypothetical protein K0M31_013481 [Melipona bicolor]|uniref:Uncharacterized protein n=1 Tax=Melipona bicolor TaxID=60889 RepID=A0AA40FI41_9HYME|nr:hypothetical protein K0M31_013481 [Melipona bicolor]
MGLPQVFALACRESGKQPQDVVRGVENGRKIDRVKQGTTRRVPLFFRKRNKNPLAGTVLVRKRTRLKGLWLAGRGSVVEHVRRSRRNARKTAGSVGAIMIQNPGWISKFQPGEFSLREHKVARAID